MMFTTTYYCAVSWHKLLQTTSPNFISAWFTLILPLHLHLGLTASDSLPSVSHIRQKNYCHTTAKPKLHFLQQEDLYNYLRFTATLITLWKFRISRHYVLPLLGITKLDKEKNQSIRGKMGAQNIVQETKQYQKKWLQHVQRMDTNRIPKHALQYRPKGRRNIGRPKKRWRDQLHFGDQGRGNTPNPSRTWWWWWWCPTRSIVKYHEPRKTVLSDLFTSGFTRNIGCVFTLFPLPTTHPAHLIFLDFRPN